MAVTRLKAYRFVLLPPATDYDTGVDIYDCFGGSDVYVVKHDHVNKTITCSCPDSTYRYGNRSREGHECKHSATFRRTLVVSSADSSERP